MFRLGQKYASLWFKDHFIPESVDEKNNVLKVTCYFQKDEKDGCRENWDYNHARVGLDKGDYFPYVEGDPNIGKYST